MKTINVLSIGNSFSHDAQRYLHEIGKSEGVSIETVNLYIGGCSLETHFRNMKGNKKAYSLEINGYSTNGFYISIEEAILARDWGYITIQQASHLSYSEESYKPYCKLLAEYIKDMCPKVKLLIHQTWGYESGSDKIVQHGFRDYDEMFDKIERCYASIAHEIGADGIIPCGKAFSLALKQIDKLHRDTFHANLGIGRFILALVWYRYLTGNSVKSIRYTGFDEEISKENYNIAIEIVEQII